MVGRSSNVESSNSTPGPENMCPCKNLNMDAYNFISQNTPKNKCQSADEKIKKKKSGHTMAYYFVMKRNKVLIACYSTDEF